MGRHCPEQRGHGRTSLKLAWTRNSGRHHTSSWDSRHTLQPPNFHQHRPIATTACCPAAKVPPGFCTCSLLSSRDSRHMYTIASLWASRPPRSRAACTAYGSESSTQPRGPVWVLPGPPSRLPWSGLLSPPPQATRPLLLFTGTRPGVQAEPETVVFLAATEQTIHCPSMTARGDRQGRG